MTVPSDPGKTTAEEMAFTTSPIYQSLMSHVATVQEQRDAAHFDGFLLGVFVGLVMALAGLVIAIGSTIG